MTDMPDLLIDGAEHPITVVLAHGAGAPMDSPFMQAFAEGLANRGIKCVRFEFPYMVRRREEEKKFPPNRAPVLLETWRKVVDYFGAENVIIGGKSMGGRMASLLAADLEAEGTPVKGYVALGYPFHAPGKPDTSRFEHLKTLKTPSLILQGERDTFGGRAQLKGFAFSKAVELHWLPDGDHGFKPRKKSGHTEAENWDAALDALARFAKGL